MMLSPSVAVLRAPPHAEDVPVAARLGPTERLHRLFDDYFDFTWKLLRRLGMAADDADDAVQEVFIVAARKLDRIAPGSERSYLVATSARVASTARRARKRRREDSIDEQWLEAMPDALPGPDELTEMKRARLLLDCALDALDSDLRVVFVLFELEGMTLPEIAAQLELPLGTAKSRLRRARERFDQRANQLKQRFSRKGVGT
jgi:RNA polymerase sigma-70 factor, ECF subfamily